MSLHRVLLLAAATMFTVTMASGAFACGSVRGWGEAVGWGGCGGTTVKAEIAPAPVEPTPTVTTYAQPLAPAPVEFHGCGCNHHTGLFVSVGDETKPMYTVDQGPDYNGPNLMEPFRVYTRDTAYAPVTAYPYIGHHGCGRCGIHVDYGCGRCGGHIGYGLGGYDHRHAFGLHHEPRWHQDYHHS